MIVIHSNKTNFLWKNRLFLGFSVLEFSKLLMYETFYDNLQPYFKQENSKLLYMDIDSFV